MTLNNERERLQRKAPGPITPQWRGCFGLFHGQKKQPASTRTPQGGETGAPNQIPKKSFLGNGGVFSDWWVAEGLSLIQPPRGVEKVGFLWGQAGLKKVPQGETHRFQSLNQSKNPWPIPEQTWRFEKTCQKDLKFWLSPPIYPISAPYFSMACAETSPGKGDQRVKSD